MHSYHVFLTVYTYIQNLFTHIPAHILHSIRDNLHSHLAQGNSNPHFQNNITFYNMHISSLNKVLCSGKKKHAQ